MHDSILHFPRKHPMLKESISYLQAISGLTMSSLNEHAEIVSKAVKTLSMGGVILFPTDTIWGLGCDARLSKGVKKILTVKNRAVEKGLILIDESYDKLKKQHPSICSDNFFKRAQAEKYPFSFVYPSYEGCCEEVKAKNGSVAVRVVEHGFCPMLIKAIGFPLVATSANISGDPFPVTFKEINPTIISQVDFVIPPFFETQREDEQRTPSPIYTLEEGTQTWIKLR